MVASGRAADKSVYAIGAGPGEHRGHALLDHPAFEFGAIGRKMHGVVEVEAVRRQCDVGGDEAASGRDDGGRGLLHSLGSGFHRDPDASETGHRPSGETEVDDVLNGGRVQHRDEAVLENVFGLVRIGGGVRAVVIAGNG